MNAAPITVLIVDDHPMVRTGLRTLLDSTADIRVVGEAGDGEQAVDLCRSLHPSVVLMDLSMPVLDGASATRHLLSENPETRVVVLTSFAEQPQVSQALAAGAVGYLLKDCDPRDLIAAVRAAAEGHVPLDPRVARTLLPRTAQSPADELSEREREVLSFVARGQANKQIAHALGISERTVKAHVGNIFRRIGVSDRTSAAMWARDHLPGGLDPARSRPRRS
jgi:DNA-binding NarL/FixJ family response regulator